MQALKCKICGGDLAIEEGSHICECEYCGARQPLPSVDNDVRANAFNRANHFRAQQRACNAGHRHKAGAFQRRMG